MGLLDGRVAVVTGGGRGIGRACALALGREGARVVVNDTGVARDGRGGDPAVAEAAADAVRALGAEAIACARSVTSRADVEALRDDAVRAFGGVDVVVSCAGILRDGRFLKMDPEDFDAVLDVQLRGAFHVGQVMARRMVEQKRGGHIVNVLAPSAFTGNQGQANLTAAAAGMYGLTRTMALELKKHDVRVNGVAPIARTRMTEELPMFASGGLTDETYGPDFVAPAVVFLASGLCGELTGDVVGVSGTRLTTFRVREGRGVVGEDPKRPWTAAEIAARWDDVARGG